MVCSLDDIMVQKTIKLRVVLLMKDVFLYQSSNKIINFI